MTNDTTPNKPKILLVDDDKDFCSNLHLAFQEKYDMDITYSLESAKEKLSQHRYDVLLLDLYISTNPPENPDGYDLIYVIKQKYARSFIIAVTIDERQQEDAYRNKVDFFFDKKTSSFQFLSTIIDENLAKRKALQGTVFLSHSSKDKIFVKLIDRKLKKAKLSTWLDEVRIKPGESIPKKVMEGIDEARYLLIFLSKKSMNSNWVKEELDTAIWKEIDEQSLTVVPIICEQFDEKLPSHLKKKSAVDFSEINDIMEISFSEILLNESKKLQNLEEIFEKKMQKLLETFV